MRDALTVITEAVIPFTIAAKDQTILEIDKKALHEDVKSA